MSWLEQLEQVLVEQGLPAIVKWLAGKAPADQIQALLDAEYRAARVAADDAARALLGPTT